MSNAIQRALACCEALNATGLLAAPLGTQSDATTRMRDLAAAGRAVELVVYWGAWRRARVGAAEEAYLKGLQAVAMTISQTLKVDCRVQLVFTDTHARLNGADAAVVADYEHSVRSALRPPFVLTRMSEIFVADQSFPVEVTGQGAVYDRLLNVLERQARTTFGLDQSDRAAGYMALNILESGHVLERWPLGLFYHVGPTEAALMLPSMPKLHGYAGKPGLKRKPWFS